MQNRLRRASVEGALPYSASTSAMPIPSSCSRLSCGWAVLDVQPGGKSAPSDPATEIGCANPVNLAISFAEQAAGRSLLQRTNRTRAAHRRLWLVQKMQEQPHQVCIYNLGPATQPFWSLCVQLLSRRCTAFNTKTAHQQCVWH